LFSALQSFSKLRPTDKQTINPGPAVDATASISSIFFHCHQLLFELSNLFFHM